MSYLMHAGSIAVTLVFCLSPFISAQSRPQSTQSAPSTSDEAAIRGLVNQLFSAYSKRDLDEFFRQWSLKAPELESRRRAVQDTLANVEKVEVKSLSLGKVTVDDDKAIAPVAVEINAINAKTATGFRNMNRVLHLVKEDGEWKVWTDVSAEEDLAAALLSAKSDQERTVLLAEHRELMTVDLRRTLATQSFRLAVKGEYPQALETIRIRQTVADLAGDKGGSAAALIDSAVVYFFLGNRLKAVESYRKVPPLGAIKDDNAAIAHILSRRGFLGAYLKSFAQALEDCRRSLSLRDSVNEKPEIAFTLTTIGMIYSAQQDYANAMDYYQKSLAVSDETGDRFWMAVPLNNIGHAYYRKHEEDLALKYLNESLALSREFGIKSMTHATLKNIGNTLFMQGKYDQALTYYYQSLALRQALGNAADIATSFCDIADAYRAEGDFERALTNYQQSLKQYEVLDDRTESAGVRLRIGLLYFDQSDYGRALEYFQKCLATAQASSDKALIAETLGDIGKVHHYQASEDLSLMYFQQSLEVLKTLPNQEGISTRESISEMLINIGEAYDGEGKHDLALESLASSLKLARTTGNNILIGEVLMTIGSFYYSVQDYGPALKCYEESLETFSRHANKVPMSDAVYSIARVYYARGDYAEALKLVQRAEGLAAESGALSKPWHERAFAGLAYRALNQFGPAREAFDQAIVMVESSRTQVAGGEQERERYFENKISPYRGMVDLLVAQNGIAEALAYAERARARALLDVLQSGRVNVSKALTGEEREQELKLNSQLASLNAQITRENAREHSDAARLADLRVNLQKARLEREAFQTDLYAMHPELKLKRGESQPLKPEDAADLLADAKSALLEYVVTPDKTFLFVLTKAPQQRQSVPDLKVYKIDIKQEELARRAESFRRQLAEHDLDFRAAATQLYEVLLKPAQAQLEGKTNLIIVPDQALWQLPFQALQSAPDKYLLEESAISYSPSLTVLREMVAREKRPDHSRPAAPTLLAMGNPSVGEQTMERVRAGRRDDKLDPLPEAEAEVKALARLYGVDQSRVYVGSEASEERLKSEAGKYEILHLATHGVLDNASPMYSHIVLSQGSGNKNEDGLLEAWEMMNLDLKAKLVVLSACETARGKIGAGEGVIGMMWALFVAGCPTTVVSQWKVDSASTAELMLEFHRNVGPSGARRSRVSRAEALRRAALILMTDKRFHHPFYWAGFVVVGDPF